MWNSVLDTVLDIAVLQAVGMMMIPIEAMPGYVVPVQDMCYPAGRANLESQNATFTFR